MPFSDRTPPLELQEDGSTYRLLADVTWTPRKPNRHGFVPVTVPRGFPTDFASVPRVLWSIFPPHGRYALAAIIHDWLCRARPEPWTGKRAHMAFREIMRDLGVSRFVRNVMYWGVRVGGPRWR